MSGPDVAIIDSGGANIASLRFALNRLNVDSVLSSDADTIRNAGHVILPGVGAAADAMQRLKAQGLDELIRELTQPVLGICLGMQILASGSEEEHAECLNILPDTAVTLPGTPGYPVPNMGWCRVTATADNALFEGIANRSYFYFLHSYVLPVRDYTIATATHSHKFTAILKIRNFYATQFHPERSGRTGATFLQNFLKLNT